MNAMLPLNHLLSCTALVSWGSSAYQERTFTKCVNAMSNVEPLAELHRPGLVAKQQDDVRNARCEQCVAEVVG